VGECFFWYRPTRVVPEQRSLNGRCCCCCCCHKAVEAAIGVLREEFGKLFEEYNEKLVAMEKRLQVVEEITRKIVCPLWKILVSAWTL